MKTLEDLFVPQYIYPEHLSIYNFWEKSHSKGQGHNCLNSPGDTLNLDLFSQKNRLQEQN